MTTIEAELSLLDALEQARLVREREATPSELAQAALHRIAATDGELNSVVIDMAEEALRRAAGPLPSGPLSGVPTLLKDLGGAYAGAPRTEGSALLAGYVDEADCELVRRYKAAGLVMLGRTNTPEFGNAATTEPRRYGPCRNPWDPARSTGGSSGGAAAAVAAGIVPIAHGSDGGGSIRIPASCCGVVGLKPTRGRVSLAPDDDEMLCGFGVEHVLARTVRDSAAALDAEAGPAPGDPYFPPQPEHSFLSEVGAPPGRLRVAVATETWHGAPLHPDCAAAVQDAAELLETLGHHVVAAAPVLDAEALLGAFGTVWTAATAWNLAAWEAALGRTAGPDDVEDVTRMLAAEGRRISATAYLDARAALGEQTRRIGRFFTQCDVALTATLHRLPADIGAGRAPASAAQFFADDAAYCGTTYLANMTGQPAISLPLHWNADGLPIGVQLTGRYACEAVLLRLAAQLEEARPWANCIPPIHASRVRELSRVRAT
ncbi:MAG TPA: amidase [Conexibacter sp.]|nr:amidase [Conexibacter sp.]